MSKWHRKFLERWASIFKKKHKELGPLTAAEYAERTFPPDLIRELVPIVNKKDEK